MPVVVSANLQSWMRVLLMQRPFLGLYMHVAVLGGVAMATTFFAINGLRPRIIPQGVFGTSRGLMEANRISTLGVLSSILTGKVC